MPEGADPVFEVIAALRFHGYRVEQLDTNPPTWLVGDDELTDWELVALALDLGLMDHSTRLQ